MKANRRQRIWLVIVLQFFPVAVIGLPLGKADKIGINFNALLQPRIKQFYFCFSLGREHVQRPVITLLARRNGHIGERLAGHNQVFRFNKYPLGNRKVAWLLGGPGGLNGV